MSLIEREYEGFKDVSIINKTEGDAEEFRREYIKARKFMYNTKKFYVLNSEIMNSIERNIDKRVLKNLFKEPENKSKVRI